MIVIISLVVAVACVVAIAAMILELRERGKRYRNENESVVVMIETGGGWHRYTLKGVDAGRVRRFMEEHCIAKEEEPARKGAYKHIVPVKTISGDEAVALAHTMIFRPNMVEAKISGAGNDKPQESWVPRVQATAPGQIAEPVGAK